MTVLSEFERTVVAAADKHDNNWEAVAFEVDRDPDTVQEIANAARSKLVGGNGTPAARPKVAPAAPASSQKPCADPECSNEFTPGSGAQKYCKDDDCKRRRWAREKRAQTGSKPRESKAAKPKPSAAPAHKPLLTEGRVMRQRFTVEVVWTQPADQEHDDDWGAVIGDALANGDGGMALWDYQGGDVEELRPR